MVYSLQLLISISSILSCCLAMKLYLTLLRPRGLQLHQAPLSMGFPRQEYWRGFPFPSPEDLPNPGIKPAYPALAGGIFTTKPPGKPLSGMYFVLNQNLMKISIPLTRVWFWFFPPSSFPVFLCLIPLAFLSVLIALFSKTHSRILAWRIPQTEEHGGLQSIGSQRVGHN